MVNGQICLPLTGDPRHAESKVLLYFMSVLFVVYIFFFHSPTTLN